MRILLADNQSHVRFALRVLLERQPGFEVVGEAITIDDVILKTETSHPDLILLDWDLPGLATVGSITALKKEHPKLFIAVISGRFEARQAALVAGADAFVSKSDPPERLLAAIRNHQH